MVVRIPQLRSIIRSIRSPQELHRSQIFRGYVIHQTRSVSLESLTTPFSRKELKAAATGNPDLDNEWYLLYVGPLARRIATYRIGAFLLSGSGLALVPIIAATAEVPMMAGPVGLLSCLPLVGYHILTKNYVLTAHLHVPRAQRSDLRTFTSYVNDFNQGKIIRFRTFRLLAGFKSWIVPVDELKLVSVPGLLQSFEKNVQWTKPSGLSFVKKRGWYVQPGLGGQEMDEFWMKIGMEEKEVRVVRQKAVARMKEISKKKVKGLQDAVEKYESGGQKEKENKPKRIVLK